MNNYVTKESLIEAYLEAEKKLGAIPPSTNLQKFGLPPVSKFNQKFGSWRKFLKHIGRNVEVKSYTRKANLKRVFTPQEYLKVLDTIKNEDHKFLLELLIHTGIKIEEARNLKVKDVDFNKLTVTILGKKTPTGRQSKGRVLEVSKYIIDKIKVYSHDNNLTKDSTFDIPTTQFVDRILKEYTSEAGIPDSANFSAHTCRRTLETWCAAIGVNPAKLVNYMGHSVDWVSVYSEISKLEEEDKVLIKDILDDLLLPNEI